MQALLVGILASLIAAPVLAAAKPCKELKTEIEAKIQAKGAKAFTLEIVPADAVKDEKVVGSCDAGSKRIIYKREISSGEKAG